MDFLRRTIGPLLAIVVAGCGGETVHDPSQGAGGAGSATNTSTGTAPPPNTFACGPEFCPEGEQYCRQVNDDTGQPPAYSCEAIPAECTGMNLSCMCLANEPCADNKCEQDADGNVKITCFGG